LEKASAKLMVDYVNMGSGYSKAAFKLFTGKPVKTHSTLPYQGNPDEIWRVIMEAEKMNNPMTGSTPCPKMTEWRFTKYLPLRHAFTVLGGMQLKNPDGSDGPRLVKMRNPWGFSMYNDAGPWGRNSDKWTDDFKK
jgi:hypothetical protein